MSNFFTKSAAKLRKLKNIVAQLLTNAGLDFTLNGEQTYEKNFENK